MLGELTRKVQGASETMLYIHGTIGLKSLPAFDKGILQHLVLWPPLRGQAIIFLRPRLFSTRLGFQPTRSVLQTGGKALSMRVTITVLEYMLCAQCGSGFGP